MVVGKSGRQLRQRAIWEEIRLPNAKESFGIPFLLEKLVDAKMDELATGTDANISNRVIQRCIEGPRNEKDSIPPSQGLEKASPLRPFMEPQDISSDIPVAERC